MRVWLGVALAKITHEKLQFANRRWSKYPVFEVSDFDNKHSRYP